MLGLLDKSLHSIHRLPAPPGSVTPLWRITGCDGISRKTPIDRRPAESVISFGQSRAGCSLARAGANAWFHSLDLRRVRMVRQANQSWDARADPLAIH